MEKIKNRLPVGLKFNNPLNIKREVNNHWLGKDEKNLAMLEKFNSVFYGFRAAFKLIRKAVRWRGYNTLRKLIMMWAPAKENGQEIMMQYIYFVADNINISPDTKLNYRNKEQMCDIVYWMMIFESGHAKCMLEDNYRGEHYIISYPAGMKRVIGKSYDIIEKEG